MGQKGISDKDWTYLIGQKFNRLTVVEIAETEKGCTWVFTECECGTKKKVRVNSLLRNKTKSCGCAQAGKGVKDYSYLIGQKVLKLTVIGGTEVINNRTRIKVRCDCGTEYYVRADGLNDTISCGCHKKTVARNQIIALSYIDGRCKERLYKIYNKIKDRVNNPYCEDYPDYGGRGIRLCKEWDGDYIVFRKWALENGYADNLSIERKNVYCDYCAKNCCWGTDLIQARNKRNTVYVTYRGVTKCISEWEEIVEVKRDNLRYYLNKGKRKGWHTDKIFEGYENKIDNYIANLNSDTS